MDGPRRSPCAFCLQPTVLGAADQACDLVAALPWREGGRVRIVSVAPTRADLLGVPWTVEVLPDADQLEDETLRVHREALDAAEREISSARSDLVIEPVLVRGRPATVIVDEARAMPADLIVVGHRGHGRVGVDAAGVGLVGGRRPRAVPGPGRA